MTNRASRRHLAVLRAKNGATRPFVAVGGLTGDGGNDNEGYANEN